MMFVRRIAAYFIDRYHGLARPPSTPQQLDRYMSSNELGSCVQRYLAEKKTKCNFG